jgi:hypothetical protein
VSRIKGEVLLVGSIPLKSAEEVFEACTEYLAPYVSCLPDGEFGPRSSWIGYLAKDVYARHPDIETLQVLDESRPTSLKDASNKWRFRIRPGTGKLVIDTGYADIALDSYSKFTAFRKAGKMPADVRFQVCFPSTGSAFRTYFDDAAEWPALARAYEDAVKRDIARLAQAIPAKDLAIQIDVCVEIRDMQNNLPYSPPRPADTKFEEAIQAVETLGSFVPPDALLGLHWCYGTLGGWPMVRIEDLELCTRLANAAVRRIPRRVDYMHVPVLRQAGESYFEPLRRLDIGDARLYLGLIHDSDGMPGFERRFALARRFAGRTPLGVASVCGYGRLSRQQTLSLFDLHRAAGAHVRASQHPGRHA